MKYLGLLLTLVTGAAFAQTPILLNCAPGTPCTASGPKATGTGDQAWDVGYKVNTNFLTSFSTLQPALSGVITTTGNSNVTSMGQQAPYGTWSNIGGSTAAPTWQTHPFFNGLVFPAQSINPGGSYFQSNTALIYTGANVGGISLTGQVDTPPVATTNDNQISPIEFYFGSDTLDAKTLPTAGGTGPFATYLDVNGSINTGAQGGRTSIQGRYSIDTNLPASAISVGYIGVQGIGKINANLGGVGTNYTTYSGSVYGNTCNVFTTSAATFLSILNCSEVDTALALGGSAAEKHNQSYVLTSSDAVRGTYDDSALNLNAQNPAIVSQGTSTFAKGVTSISVTSATVQPTVGQEVYGGGNKIPWGTAVGSISGDCTSTNGCIITLVEQNIGTPTATLSAQTAASVFFTNFAGWGMGISFGSYGHHGAFTADSTYIGDQKRQSGGDQGSPVVTNGVFFGNTTFLNCAFGSTGFCVDGAGNITANSFNGGAAQIANGTVMGRCAGTTGPAQPCATLPTGAIPAFSGGDVTSMGGSLTLTSNVYTIGAGVTNNQATTIGNYQYLTSIDSPLQIAPGFGNGAEVDAASWTTVGAGFSTATSTKFVDTTNGGTVLLQVANSFNAPIFGVPVGNSKTITSVANLYAAAPAIGLPNGIKTVNTLTGTGTTGTYTGIQLIGGGGGGTAYATVVVTAGTVTAVTITTYGTGYAVNDNLTFTITGGSGTAKVATLIFGTTTNTNLYAFYANGNAAVVGTVSAGGIQLTTTPILVTALGTCNTAAKGTMIAVSDANSSWGATVMGGGSTYALAICDGTNWTTH